MKGLILAGGAGSRLFPLTKAITKQLLPVYDKPMIFYPLSLLMLAGIKEFMIITSPEDRDNFVRVLGDGSELGISISYKAQEKPNGIAQAFILAEDFIGNDSVTFILGDNIFYGHGLPQLLQESFTKNTGATIFGHYVNDPERYGVATCNSDGLVIELEEKPRSPKSNLAVTGLYVYNNDVVHIAHNTKPSARGELEITDVNKAYLQQNSLKLEILGRGTAWLDTGTHESLYEASKFVEVIESRQGLKIACLEEIAYRKNFISHDQLVSLSKKYNNEYGQYLSMIAQDKP
ncbi:glucose-1-phosphate thymidylyltransferase [Candidatus Marinamargulisbacteria bacterium SCGC AG-343-D04]|nr:glucose-1-phosphate thymidylyltransferase [Candidatus Marinamargulisbacteria bacterium SCGC AG-343-D04]